LKQNGVYIITGGIGGLGFIFAEYLGPKKFNARLVLGRSVPLSQRRRKKSCNGCNLRTSFICRQMFPNSKKWNGWFAKQRADSRSQWGDIIARV